MKTKCSCCGVEEDLTPKSPFYEYASFGPWVTSGKISTTFQFTLSPTTAADPQIWTTAG